MLEARRVYDGPSIASVRRESAETPDLVVVGAASRDLTDRDARGWRLGGSATYCSLAAARLGLRVGCLVGVDGLAADADELELLRLAGVLLRPVALEHGPVFDNIEEDGHRHQRWRSMSDAIPVAALPDEWRTAGGWLLGPVAGELPDGWAAAVPADARVGLGWQGLLRDFGADGWMERKEPAASPLVGRAGLACASVDDLPPGFDVAELRRLASAATIVVTAGAQGSLVLQGAGINRYAAVAADGVEDPTGAGDVFMAALMVAWLAWGELATPYSLLFAAAAGSLVVEGVGLAGVATRVEVESRMGDHPPRDRSRD
jgi:sugar/nucleoside kinase (ribokinase family)